MQKLPGIYTLLQRKGPTTNGKNKTRNTIHNVLYDNSYLNLQVKGKKVIFDELTLGYCLLVLQDNRS